MLTIKYCERTFCCSNTPTLLALFDLHTVAELGPWCLLLYMIFKLSSPVLVLRGTQERTQLTTNFSFAGAKLEIITYRAATTALLECE